MLGEQDQQWRGGRWWGRAGSVGRRGLRHTGSPAGSTVKIALSRLANSRHLVSAPPRRTAVTHAALRRRLYFWARYVVAMDPEALLAAEQAMARGESSQNQVRLPSWASGSV
jgi:hypothetical protein